MNFFRELLLRGKNVRIEYLSQNQNFKEDATILEQIFRGKLEK